MNNTNKQINFQLAFKFSEHETISDVNDANFIGETSTNNLVIGHNVEGVSLGEECHHNAIIGLNIIDISKGELSDKNLSTAQRRKILRKVDEFLIRVRGEKLTKRQVRERRLKI